MEHLNKKYLIISVLVFLAIVIGWLFLFLQSDTVTDDQAHILSDPFNLEYKIGDDSFFLIKGVAEKEYLPDSISKNRLSIFGAPTYSDLDNDGDIDAAVLLENDPGGSGTFYYAALAINNNGTFKATETMFLGDRIVPQTVEIHDGRAVYNIMERRSDEPMSTEPSIGKSIWVHFDKTTNSIGEWVKDFEGEIDMNRTNNVEANGVQRNKVAIYSDSRVGLSNSGLTEVPEHVFTESETTALDLSGNKLTGALPAEIRHLKKLTSLNLSDNNFTGVPAEIGQLEYLEILNLSNNPITGLPYELGNLKNLQVLDLSNTNYSKPDLEVIKKTLPNRVEIIL